MILIKHQVHAGGPRRQLSIWKNSTKIAIIMTAGLEAKLNLAVGARVMLCRNIDTKVGLVNGAIGTVIKIAMTTVTVRFDKIDASCDVE